MTEQIKSNLITAYMVFVHDFADPAAVDKAALEAKMQCKLEDMFKRQRLADLAKKRLGEEFPKALALFFGRFLTADGFDHAHLAKVLLECEKALALHLKKDSMRYLSLLVKVMALVDDKPRGLLAS